MKMKLFGLLIGVLLQLSPGLMGQGTPYAATAAPGGSPPTCGSIWKVEAFEADAVWTVPTGVEVVWVTGVGGGGGGAPTSSSFGGGGGGGASSSHRVPVSVGELTSVNIVIGLGGSQNQSGGNTLFGDFVVGRGGGPGKRHGAGTNGAGFHGDSIEGAMFASGGGGGSAYYTSRTSVVRTSGGNASGGSGGKGGYSRGAGGGGGASAFGRGGDGGSGSSGAGKPGQGHGAGGGGGDRHSSGGKGSNGYLLIEWSAP